MMRECPSAESKPDWNTEEIRECAKNVICSIQDADNHKLERLLHENVLP